MTNQEAIKVLNCTSLLTFCLCKVAIDGKMLSMKEALGMGIEALENQSSVIEELKKIKAEIEDKILLNQTVAIQILDNHIAELKGEQE